VTRNLPPATRKLRWASLVTYCALAALGEAAALKPALLFLRSLRSPAVWHVPFGAVFVGLSIAVAALAFWVVVAERPRLAVNAALLAAAAIAVALRSVAPAPQRVRAVEKPAEVPGEGDGGLPVYPHVRARRKPL
jgi:hypothetical protein